MLVYIVKEGLSQIWDWFWIYRQGKIKLRVLKIGDSYEAMASDGTTAVWHCFGGTPEAAKEMAHYRLRHAYEEK